MIMKIRVDYLVLDTSTSTTIEGYRIQVSLSERGRCIINIYNEKGEQTEGYGFMGVFAFHRSLVDTPRDPRVKSGL